MYLKGVIYLVFLALFIILESCSVETSCGQSKGSARKKQKTYFTQR